MSARAVSATPLWHAALSRSIRYNKHERTTSWFQLATIDGDGWPAVRNVVFRGFYSEHEAPKPMSAGGSAAESSAATTAAAPAVAEADAAVEAEAGGGGGAGDAGSSGQAAAAEAAAHAHPLYLQIVTDARSEKVAHITRAATDGRAEICWYFPVTREQWRIRGRITLIAPPPSSSSLSHEALHSVNRTSIPLEKLYAAREAAWASMSDGARASFAWPAPGAPRLPTTTTAATTAATTASTTSAVDASGAGGFEITTLPATLPPASSEAGADAVRAAWEAARRHFCLLLVEPLALDHLCLKQQPTQSRWKYTQVDDAASAGEQGQVLQGWKRQFVNP